MRRLLACIASATVFGFVSAAPVFAQTLDDYVEELIEAEFVIEGEFLEEQESSLLDSIEALTAADVSVAVLVVEDSDVVSADLAPQLFDESDFELLLIHNDARLDGFAAAETDADVNLQLNLACALDSSVGVENFDDSIAVFVSELLSGCAEVVDQAETEEGKDRFGAEGLGFVIDEIADDNTYVGSTREDINEAELIAAVEEVNTFTGLRLIVVAPDNPQPSASAFARRLQEETKAEVLLFPKGDRVVSSVTEDLSQPRDADINTRARNQACATRAAWSQETQANAVNAFGDRLADGCPFEPPTFLLLVLGGLALSLGAFGLVTLKENEIKVAKRNASLPAPEPDQLIVASPRRADVTDPPHVG